MNGDYQIDMGRRPALVVGGLLIIIGILALVSQIIPGMGLVMWAGTLAALGVGAFGLYLTDRSQPGILIPAYILWAVAGLLTGIGVGFLDGIVIPVYVLSAIALPFVYGFGRNPKENWGLLIPAYVLSSIAAMLLGIGAGILDGIVIPIFVLSVIAFPFLIGFASNPAKNWGLVIPAYVMFAICGLLAGLGLGILVELAIPAYIMFAIAAPFLLTFSLNRRENWWAIIPGGIMSAIGLAFLAGTYLFRFGLPAVLIVIGIIVLLGPTLVRSRILLAGQEMHKPLRGPEADVAPIITESRERDVVLK